jgi:serine/threonine protein kinase
VDLANLYGAEVLLAICYLHERDTVYRDMKPENVVLDQDGHAMLTDFGLSKEGVHGLDAAKSFCGSWAFMAPEIIKRKGHGKTVDTYGIGVMTYCMLVGAPPFYNRSKDTLLHNIKHQPLKVPSFVPEAAADFVQATMRKDPKDRLGAGQTEDLKGHEWFSNVSWTALMNRDVPVPEGIFDKKARSNFTASDPSIGAEAVYGQMQRHAKSRSGAQHVANWEFASPGEEALKRNSF